ncbi:uncharacterized protein LOC110449214 [Mizuhopecten yessoensis]|uniref:N-acetyltransferase domain-containing protein n=1 Tax=Mizuhopecten yessoensis TaxID=6573 RepID=A0A210R5W7_MIZYE|nr:uncharacterized protein LOC110449214 [Mizuhopecten yessoensis]OWF56345.1 hypothetical protein KP79_PYT08300 [Mizuhopecten yessoensis]
MAEGQAGLDAFDSVDIIAFKNALTDLRSAHETMDDNFSRPGAQLADKQTFTNKTGELITAYPVLVDLRRLVQLCPSNTAAALTGDDGIIPGISNTDLLHAVVGLYDVSLSEMTPDVLYATVCEKWARTIVLVRDLKETVRSLEEKKIQKTSDKDDDNETESKETKTKEEKEDGENDDIYEEEEQLTSKFADVYSDTESEEEDLEDDDDEEDFSKGINTFIKKTVERRKKRQCKPREIKEEQVGIENRIIGCVTFEKKYVRQKDRVVHLTLLSVRRRHRKFGIGKYLLQQVIDPAVVGHFDAIVVHADNAAVEFFQHFGFSDDVVLNSRWSELAEQFTNCTLMCYLPGFSGHSLLSTVKVPGFEVFELEQEFNKWKEKTVEVYQNQVSVVMRMKHEILQLKALTHKQNTLIETLLKDNEKLRKEKYAVEKEYLGYKFSTAKASSLLLERSNSDDGSEISSEDLINELQQQVDSMDLTIKKKRLESLLETNPEKNSKLMTFDDSKYVSFPPSNARNTPEPYDHMKDAAFFYDVTERFKKSMKLDPAVKSNNEVTTISKATLTEQFMEDYKNKLSTLIDSSIVVDLYYCGTLEHPERIPDILTHGFTESDFIHGEYGRGLYFSKYPSKAAHFSGVRKILLVEAGLGHIESITKQDRARKSPHPGHDSIITPGRLKPSRDCGLEESTMTQEYVVFDAKQVMPLGLITYDHHAVS